MIEMDSVASDYPDAWRTYRIRWWLWMGAWLGIFPLELFLGAPLGLLFHSPLPFNVIAVLAMASFVIGGLLVLFWPCPRCGNQFHQSGIWTNALARKCMHCGLRKRSPSS
jgi:hypothetical protein